MPWLRGMRPPPGRPQRRHGSRGGLSRSPRWEAADPLLKVDQRVFLERLKRQRHAPALDIDVDVDVDVENLGRDLLADRDDIRRVIYASPRQLRDIDHRGEAADVHEGHAEVGDLDDSSRDDLTSVKCSQEGRFSLIEGRVRHVIVPWPTRGMR
ncbi:hypothetical protein ACQP2K_33075 [Microbispora siamensis]